MLDAVKGVRGLSLEILSIWFGVSEQVKDTKRQHGSDEACLKAVVEAFLLGEGDYQPSWRTVIHALHKANESHRADQIKNYAEPVQGECVWVIVISYSAQHFCKTQTSYIICMTHGGLCSRTWSVPNIKCVLSYKSHDFHFQSRILTLLLSMHMPNSLQPAHEHDTCLLYTSPSPRDATLSRMPSSA